MTTKSAIATFFACCIILCGFPALAQRSGAAILFGPRSAGQAQETRDVVIGDTIVNILEPPLRQVTIIAAADSRFKYPRTLLKVTVIFHLGVDDRVGLYEYEDIVRNTPPDSKLYDVPPPMRSFPLYAGKQVLIEIPGTTFMGRPAYVVCALRNASELGERRCNIASRISEMARVEVQFTDDLYPPGEWPAFFRSMEEGIRAISRPK